MLEPSHRIVILTAGAGGMYCGSCLNDNTLAKALIGLGIDVQLVPLYTPLRTDMADASVDRVFLGGINVALQQKLPFMRFGPLWLDRWLNNPRLLRWATSGSLTTTARELGALTVSMLQGSEGRQRKEITRLVHWLADEAKPDLICLSNLLIAGCVGDLKRKLDLPVLALLQGDDVFLDQLIAPYQQTAMQQIRQLARQIDGFITHSAFYADAMAEYLDLDRNRIDVVPLGIDTTPWQTADVSPAASRGRRIEGSEESVDSLARSPLTIGYLARQTPEKGLHLLGEAFRELRQRPETADVQLRVAGWEDPSQAAYRKTLRRQLAPYEQLGAVRFEGTVDLAGKLRMLREIDILSVPTTYRDPKGRFVLEAMAQGVPVVEPDHGVFPELIGQSGGGRLFRAQDVEDLAAVLFELLTDSSQRHRLSQQGRNYVLSHRRAQDMAEATWAVYQRYL